MCTVLYIPGQDALRFASLRDESPIRPKAFAPVVNLGMNVRYISPQDALAGGTWVGANEYGNVIVLLNGGLRAHTRQEKYARSRGLIVNELLGAKLPVVAWHLLDLTRIEPFTLVVWSDALLFQLIWDGTDRHRLLLDARLPHIWSSSTLYAETAEAERSARFHTWMTAAPAIDAETVLAFFRSYADPQDGFIMNRAERVKTLSYSFLTLALGQSIHFRYHELQSDSVAELAVDLSNADHLGPPAPIHSIEG
jgi:hypothetical protein